MEGEALVVVLLAERIAMKILSFILARIARKLGYISKSSIPVVGQVYKTKADVLGDFPNLQVREVGLYHVSYVAANGKGGSRSRRGFMKNYVRQKPIPTLNLLHPKI